jgi:hypothetical protein
MKRFCEYFRKGNPDQTVSEDIFIGQGTQLQDPIPGTNITDTDLTPTQKQNKFKKKNAQRER